MSAGNPTLQLRLDAKRRARYEAAADKAGRKLVDWARDQLDQAAAPAVSTRTVRVPEVELARRAAGGKRFTGPDPKAGKH